MNELVKVLITGALKQYTPGLNTAAHYVLWSICE